MADTHERATHLLSDQDGMSTPDQEPPGAEPTRRRRSKKHRKKNTVTPSGNEPPVAETEGDKKSLDNNEEPEGNVARRSRVFGSGEGKLGSVNIKTTSWLPDQDKPTEVIDGNITITASYPSFTDINASEENSPQNTMSTTSTILTTWPPPKSQMQSTYKLEDREGNPNKHWSWAKMVEPYKQCLLQLNKPDDESVIISYFISHYKELANDDPHPDQRKSFRGTEKDLPDIKLNMAYIAEKLEEGINIDQTDLFGQTILMEAVRSWHTSVARYLIDNDADIRHHDSIGRTPMHVAAAADRDDMIELLCEKGACINTKLTLSGETPLHLAARRGSLKALGMLLSKGANTEVTDYRGRTALYVAAEYNRQPSAGILIQAGASVDIVDKNDTSLLVQLASNSSPVIELAFDKLIHYDNMTGEGLVNSEILETCPRDWYEEVQTNCLLDVIESVEHGVAVRHTAIRDIIERRWYKFGRFWAIVNFLFRFLFFLVWTTWILILRWERKGLYKWPDDGWRLVVPIIGLIALILELRIEVAEFMYSMRRGVKMTKLKLSRLAEDKQFFFHPCWLEEYDFLQDLSRKAHEEKHFRLYTKDPWNTYDIVVFFLLIGCVITHIIDAIDHTPGRSRLHGQLGSIIIILLGIRLMKEARGFALIGELVIMLGLMATDFRRFIFLYLQLYIPFTIAFWVIFGGERYPFQRQTCMFSNCTNLDGNSSSYVQMVNGWVPDFDVCKSNCSTIRVVGMEEYPTLCFSLFRLTLVDEYDLEAMRAIDPYLAYILVGAFLVTSAIVGINFLIGLISNALSDGAKQYVDTYSLLQKIRVINLIEQSIYLCRPRPEECREELVRKAGKCSKLLVATETTTSETMKEAITEMRKDLDLINKLIKKVDHIQEEQETLFKMYKRMEKEETIATIRSGDTLTYNCQTQAGHDRWLRNNSGLGKLGSFGTELSEPDFLNKTV